MPVARRNRVLEAAIGLVLAVTLGAVLAMGNWTVDEAEPINPNLSADGTAPINSSWTQLDSYHFIALIERPGDPVHRDCGRISLVFEGWYEAPNKTRWEIKFTIDEGPYQTGVIGTDGMYFYAYGRGGEGYTEEKLDAPLAGPLLFPTNYQIGPLPDPTDLNYRGIGEPILGRKTFLAVYEAWSTEGPASFWVDQEFPFVLKLVVETGQAFTAEVTEVQYNIDIDDSVFDFSPPEGEPEEEPSCQPGA
jgi:outer membrane lipoprotein-sorting protein